jgi:hypothetical protein
MNDDDSDEEAVMDNADTFLGRHDKFSSIKGTL